MRQENPLLLPPVDDQAILDRGYEIGRILQEKRTSYKLSLRECAKRISVSRQHYADIEAGRARIKLVELEELMRFLFIKPESVWPEWGNIFTRRKATATVQVPAGQRVIIVVEGVEGVQDPEDHEASL